MRKKIIIFIIALVLVVACFFEYSNYQNKALVLGEQSCIAGGGNHDFPIDGFQFEDNVKCASLNINTECGQFIKREDGQYSNDMKKIPNKGSIIIEIRDDDSNVVKSFTIKGGESLSKTVFLGKGSYDLKITTKDGFEGKMESKVYSWKLI